jgi:hypothetical protein
VRAARDEYDVLARGLQPTSDISTNTTGTHNRYTLVGVNYLDRSATTILAGGSGE